MKWYKMGYEIPTWETECQRGRIERRGNDFLCEAMRRGGCIVESALKPSLPEAKTWCENEMRK